MNKITVNAVSSLVSQVINTQLIPRVKREILIEQDVSVVSHYQNLLKYFEEFPTEEARATSEKALAIINKTFMGIAKSDLEDLLSTVIASTLQGKDNGYNKVKKSTFGFWENGYNLKQPISNFTKAFCHVLYKAVQSQTRNLETLRKHETLCSSMSSDENFNFLDVVADIRTPEKTYNNMNSFENAVKRFYDTVMSEKSFDEVDRMLFQIWFDLKNEVDFTEPVRMSSAVYPKLIEQLEEKGVFLKQGAMHYRWNKIRQVVFSALS